MRRTREQLDSKAAADYVGFREIRNSWYGGRLQVATLLNRPEL
jgi:hypothetical protein